MTAAAVPALAPVPGAPLRGLRAAELGAWVASAGAPAYRAEQLFRWLHGQVVDSLDQMVNVARERVVVDPGFGFAKTPEQNFRLLDELATVVALGYPVAVGPSRKRFLGAATGRPVEDRDRATAVACALAWERGARLFRVHDAALAREALRVAAATTNAR